MPESVEYNLFTRFTFKNQPGMGAMKQTGQAFAGLYRNARLAQAGVRQVGTGLRQFGMFGMAAAGAVGLLVKKGIDFGKQWANVRAVVTATPKQFAKLRTQAKYMGATTLFTATQAAEGMEHLGRASLSVGQIQSAIRPTLKLAVADNVELGRAAQIVAASIKTFGMEAKDASDVADLFAYTSKNSMTNVTALGESIVYAGTAAKLTGQNIYDTVGTLGLLAQIGLKGSIAGTAYKNALVKLAKGSEAAYKLFGGKKGFLKVMSDTNGEFKRFPDIIKLTIQKLGTIKNKVERAGMAFKIFGIRGIAGFAALKKRGGKDYVALIDNIRAASKGTAEEMAKIKQQNVHGQFTLLKSALTGVALEIYDVVQPSIISFVSTIKNAFQDTANALQMMNRGFSETQVAAKYGKTIAGIVFGVKESIFEVGATIKRVSKTTIGFFMKLTGKSKISAKSVTKLITKFILFAAALAPIIMGVGVLSLAFGGMFNVVAGGFKILSALTSYWGIAFLAITLMFSGGRKKGESFVTTMVRGLKKMISLANKLLWPFKQIAKHLGTIPALMAGIVAYKGARGLLARGGSMLAGARSPLLRGAGKLTGAATGMPVYVTNWPMGGMGGMGGGMGGMGAAGAGAAARKVGMFGRMGAAARYAGMSLPGMAIGGKFVGGGAMGAGTALGKSAALVSGAGTAAMALGAFTAAIAPAVGGLYALNRAYDKGYQLELRDKLMKQQRAKEEQKTWMEIKLGLRTKGGKLKGFTSLEESKKETWAQFYQKRATKEYGVTETESASLRKAYSQIRGGQTYQGYGGAASFGMGRIRTLGAEATDAELKQLGLSREMINVLMAVSNASSKQVDQLAQGFSTTVVIDGKEIAITTAKTRQESNERAGKPPSPGARRRALERGT